jgi:antitoxin YefM
MDFETTYTQARANLASLMDKAVDDKVPIFITRKNGKRVAMVDADEYESMVETLYLFRSPANAALLIEAFERSERGEGKVMSLKELRREVGFDRDEA